MSLGGRFVAAFDVLEQGQQAILGVIGHAYDEVLHYRYVEVAADQCRTYIKSDIYSS
ncbi:MAG: hypothetical protein KTR20_14585 [Cellvibrionaceae bacterium]|nr:hypothetical protein [Cellvibrionaceae bacterium]